MRSNSLILGLLVSGNLGYKILRYINRQYEVRCLFTDRESRDVINYARQKNIKLYVGNPRGSRTAKFIKGLEIDVLLSVNYLFLIEEDLINFPSKCAINIHGSLLPKYRGRTPHIWAIINNEKYAGVTVHIINKECDSGNIILQKKVPIGPDDTGADILKKYFRLYPATLLQVLQKLEHGMIKSIPQDESKATYFGKRCPDDGKVDWNWQKERIRNWVRALSKPYPGAFSYYNGRKIIFHETVFSDIGFHSEQPNGLIIQVRHANLYVKSPNGVIILQKINGFKSFKFEIGRVLE